MSEQKSVLIVEDDRFLSSLIKARLEKEGVGVAQAFDGEEGLKELKQKKHSLIVLDLIMPKISGFELLESISVNPEWNQIPVIVLTNLAQEEDVKKVKQLGAVEYFVKIRVSIDDLIKKVREIIG